MTDAATSGQLLFAKLRIDLDEVSIEKLSDYTAVEYFLTVEDEPPPNATNLEKVKRYLESFHHLCEVEDWERAYIISSENKNPHTDKRVDEQLHIWSYYNEQIELCKRLLGKLNQTKEAILMSSLGTAYSLLGQYQTAIEYHQKSLEISRRLGNRQNEAIELGNIGSVYNNQGYFQKAEEYCKKSLYIAYSEPKLVNQIARMIELLSMIYSALREFEKAIEGFQKQLELAYQLGDKEMEADALKGLGTAYRSNENPQKGIQYSQQALLIHQELGDLLGQAHCLNNIGVAYKNLKEYDKAIDHQKRALAIFRQIGNLRDEAITLCNLGICYKNLSEYETAIDYQEKSIAICKNIGILDEEARVNYEIAGTYELMGQLDKMYLFSMKALWIYDYIKHPFVKRVLNEVFVPLVVDDGLTVEQILYSRRSQLEEIVAEYGNAAAERIVQLIATVGNQ